MTDQEKIIYDILCSDEQPPEGQHWEGFVTNKIVAALAQPEPWVKTYSGGKPNYTEPCERCGEVNPAEIHTCTPKQPEQEPVAWMWDVYSGAGYTSRGIDFYPTNIPFAKHTPLYATPPQREWVDLTEEEIEDLTSVMFEEPSNEEVIDFASRVQAKLKEKNNG